MPDGPNFLGKRGDICERRMVDPRAEASGEKGHEATRHAERWREALGGAGRGQAAKVMAARGRSWLRALLA